MFAFGLFTLFLGYAMLYTAIANLRNGFKGPKLSHSLGLDVVLAPPTGSSSKAGTTSPERRGGSGQF